MLSTFDELSIIQITKSLMFQPLSFFAFGLQVAQYYTQRLHLKTFLKKRIINELFDD